MSEEHNLKEIKKNIQNLAVEIDELNQNKSEIIAKIEKKTTILKCENCERKAKRPFESGEFVFKKISGKPCPKCNKTNYIITQIFGEWIKGTRKELKSRNK